MGTNIKYFCFLSVNQNLKSKNMFYDTFKYVTLQHFINQNVVIYHSENQSIVEKYVHDFG